MSQVVVVSIKWHKGKIILNWSFTASCPPNKPKMFCPESFCNYQSCSNFPNAQCVIDNCGQCRATFIENGTDVTDQCSKFYLNN